LLFQLDEALTLLRNLKRDEYESPITLKILRFLENLIHQPKEWISGAKLKLSEMKFPGSKNSVFQQAIFHLDCLRNGNDTDE